MGRLVRIFVITALLAACSKEKSGSSSVSGLSKPADCTYIGTETHQFRGFPAEVSSVFSCSVPEGSYSECYYYESVTGQREINCLASVNNGLYSQCGTSMTGTRFFFDQTRTFPSGNMLSTTTRYCGMFYQLHCWISIHGPDMTDSNYYEDLQCVEY